MAVLRKDIQVQIKNRLSVIIPCTETGQVVEYHVTNTILTAVPEAFFVFPLRENRQFRKMSEKAQRLLRHFFENGARSVTLCPRSIQVVLASAYRLSEVGHCFEKMIGLVCFDGARFEIDDGTTPKKYFSPGTALVDCDDIPAAIVAVTDGHPLILLVSEETLNAFNAESERLGISHVELANKLRDAVCCNGGQFHENAVAAALHCR